VWTGWSTLFPLDWPVMPSGGWCGISSVFGPPYAGSGPCGFGVEGGEEEIEFAGDGTPGVKSWLLPIVRGVWMDFAVHYVMSADAAYGLAEVFTCTNSSTWVQARFGETYGLHLATLKPGVNDGGPNSSRLMLYRQAGMFSTLSVKHAAHKVATTCQSALPASYPSATKPWEL